MSEILDTSERERSLKTIGVVSYLLHAIVAVAALVPGFQVGAGLLVVAFIIDLVKKDDAAGTWQESHFRWRIRSVVVAMVLYALTSPLWLLLLAPGWLAWGLISIWFLYRIVRGWLCLNDNRPVA
ncbi:DUF4870 family protein [Eleftheria terrae]|uniref:DUF4870 family protein n=1 Tax=Eleftheria terrae TaxID=1597781 RepID=UPI00263B0F6B|nr:hypothetical protein [Eleftheria terrae]WKB54775.1 hypothetical protein N7L95_10495 [Eleftheria terrae]